jgi:hypothetical protein
MHTRSKVLYQESGIGTAVSPIVLSGWTILGRGRLLASSETIPIEAAVNAVPPIIHFRASLRSIVFS